MAPLLSDPFPGHLKILFIGLSESTHTQSWIRLLDEAEFNVRLFARPSGFPPAAWHIPTYITGIPGSRLDLKAHESLYLPGKAGKVQLKVGRLLNGTRDREEQWLASIIRRWQPDVIHTLGLDQGGYFYHSVRQKYHLGGIGRWVLQLWGGSDLSLSRLNPQLVPKISQVLQDCDFLLSDNEPNYGYAAQLGARPSQIPEFGIIPGTGGLEVDEILPRWNGKPSSRRLIVWPKAYESPWSKALPVFEALKLCWEQIQPCEVSMLAATPEVRMWYWSLPEKIRQACQLHERIPQAQVLDLMVRARVMLAPSLIDGTPNSMVEAFAAGALPIVSPLDTICPMVQPEQNVLFARNLYPQEIADALARAMSDDLLVDRAAENNLSLVRGFADRSRLKPKIIDFYQKIGAARK